MKKFLLNLVSNSNEVSSKRIIGLLSFIVLVVMVAIRAYGREVDEHLIYVFAGLVGGQSILTVIDKNNNTPGV